MEESRASESGWERASRYFYLVGSPRPGQSNKVGVSRLRTPIVALQNLNFNGMHQ